MLPIWSVAQITYSPLGPSYLERFHSIGRLTEGKSIRLSVLKYSGTRTKKLSSAQDVNWREVGLLCERIFQHRCDSLSRNCWNMLRPKMHHLNSASTNCTLTANVFFFFDHTSVTVQEMLIQLRASASCPTKVYTWWRRKREKILLARLLTFQVSRTRAMTWAAVSTTHSVISLR